MCLEVVSCPHHPPHCSRWRRSVESEALHHLHCSHWLHWAGGTPRLAPPHQLMTTMSGWEKTWAVGRGQSPNLPRLLPLLASDEVRMIHLLPPPPHLMSQTWPSSCLWRSSSRPSGTWPVLQSHLRSLSLRGISPPFQPSLGTS